MNISNFTFILVEPAVPENAGAAARAMKTMGFTDLRIVAPGHDSPIHLTEKALTLAHGSREILAGAMIFSSLAEAVHDLDFLVATTARR